MAHMMTRMAQTDVSSQSIFLSSAFVFGTGFRYPRSISFQYRFVICFRLFHRLLRYVLYCFVVNKF